MRSLIALSFFVPLIFGCAVQPIVLSKESRETIDLPVKSVSIDNLATDVKVSVGEVVYVNGWAPAHGGFSPSLHEAFSAKLKATIRPTGSADFLNITLLRAGFFVEKNVGDDVVLVGLLTAMRERGFKCDADVNIKRDGRSERRIFEYQIRRSYFENSDQIRDFIELCHANLIRQISQSIL